MRLDKAFKSNKQHEIKSCEILIVNLVKSCEEILQDWEGYANHLRHEEVKPKDEKFESLKGLRIVVADDDPVIRTLMVRKFEDKNIQVEAAKNGKEALDKVLATNPQFIILDENMPEMNGSDVCRALLSHKQAQEIPVFLLSGYDSGELHDLHGLTNLKKVFEKPLQVDVLLNHMAQFV